MRTVEVIVDSHLRLDGNLIGHDIANVIFDELTIYNHAKDVAKKMKRWGWQDLPDDFLLGELDGDTVVMPRGYAYQLKTLLREKRLRVQWVDRRKWKRGAPFHWNGMMFKPHQYWAIKKIVKHQQGMYEAPTGSGKTVTCIGFIINRQPQKTIILVDQIGLLHQWRAELALWLGLNIDDIGQIGDGKWNEGARITVATVQTLRSKVPDDEWFKQWDAVILDECHHVTAETIQAIVGAFTAKYRFGVSATTDRKDDKFEFALHVLGEVFHQDDEEELRDAGVLMRPRVKVIRTKFDFTFWPDHNSDDENKCLVPKCRLSGQRPHFHRNNFQHVKTALVNDKARNRLVIDTLLKEVKSGEHHHLIVSDQIAHLQLLMEALWDSGTGSHLIPGVYLMTGQIRGKEREKIKEEIKNAASAIVFATVAKEGMDIPAIDRIYLPFPVNSAPKVQQWIGRGTRIMEGKLDTVVFDFFDILIDIYRKQFRSRRFKCYDQLHMEVDLG